MIPPQCTTSQGCAHGLIKLQLRIELERLGQSRVRFPRGTRRRVDRFKTSHQERIEEVYEAETRAYNLDVLSLTESISFIEGFMIFIDDYMKHLTQAKFGVKKAFHVTTRLTKGMWIALVEPRNGIMKMFKAGNLPQIGSTIFWANLRSLD
jgi:hypothetical protein